MTPEQFIYWLQGHVELLENDKPPSKKQWQIIRDHLNLVFFKQTPDRSDFPEFDPFDITRRPNNPLTTPNTIPMTPGDTPYHIPDTWPYKVTCDTSYISRNDTTQTC